MIADDIITASVTVLIGVTVYALSQIVVKFYIEPIHKLDEIRGEIAESLIFYANISTNPGSEIIPMEKMRETSSVLRQKATLLTARTYLIRGKRFFSSVGIIPKMSDIDKASHHLILLSNTVFEKDLALKNYAWAEEIWSLLKLRPMAEVQKTY